MAKDSTTEKKIIAYVGNSLCEQLDAYAKSMNITRSSAICVILATYFQSKNGLDNIGKLMKAYEDEQNRLSLSLNEKVCNAETQNHSV